MSSVPNQVYIEQDTANQVIIDEAAPNQVIIRAVAYTSGTSRRHIHSQPVAASTWMISHELGGKPSVTIVDSADTVVVGEVTYNSNSVVEVNFTSAFSGFAYLT